MKAGLIGWAIVLPIMIAAASFVAWHASNQ